MNLIEWIDPASYGSYYLYFQALEKLVSNFKKDPSTWGKWLGKYGIDHFLAWYMWSWVNVNIPYQYDSETFKRVDWWCLPTESLDWALAKLVGGLDCEDCAILLASGLERLRPFRNEASYYYCVLGFYYNGKDYYGHGYDIWLDKYLSEAYKKPYWATMETTLDNEVSPFIAYPWNPEQYIPAVCFNRKEELIMTIKIHREKLGLTDDWFNKHKGAIEAMLNYIQTGEKLTYHFAHKTKERRVIPKVVERIVPE